VLDKAVIINRPQILARPLYTISFRGDRGLIGLEINSKNIGS
jgi:hypothetical protein